MRLPLTQIDRAETLRCLGYRTGSLKPALDALIDRCREQALETITPLGCYRLLPLTASPGGLLLGELPLPGEDIARHLAGCTRAYLLAVTLGPALERLIAREMLLRPDAAVILDACGSAACEQAADALCAHLVHECGAGLTLRFSPGYGDLPLSLQPELLDLLDAGRAIGLSVSASCQLLPQKSVTALVGVAPPQGTGCAKGCAGCANRERCAYRRG